MKKQAFTLAAVASVLLLGGCCEEAGKTGDAAAPATSAAASGQSGENVAIVNGKAISKTVFDAISAEMKQRGAGRGMVPDDKVLDGLISRELLNQEAEKLNLAKDPAIQAKLDNARRDVMVMAMVENLRKTLTVSEEEIKKEYDTRVQALKGTEYKARHILLDSEAAAKDAIAKLQKGAKFEDLAKKLSKDPSAKQNNGDLGWFNPQSMVPEFSAAVAALKNGELSAAPVKSQFGWHVIQRQDSREQEAPPFDAVKDQFRTLLLGQKVQEHVEQLKASAKVERLLQTKPPEAPGMEGAAPAANPTPAPAAAGKSAPAPLEAGKPVAPAPK
ncbi:MAG: peptidylprolyl isomerase [Candidatus Methylumidiphilus sp.]